MGSNIRPVKSRHFDILYQNWEEGTCSLCFALVKPTPKMMVNKQTNFYLNLRQFPTRRRLKNWLTMQRQHFLLVIYFLTLCTLGKITDNFLLTFLVALMYLVTWLLQEKSNKINFRICSYSQLQINGGKHNFVFFEALNLPSFRQ